MYKRPNPNYKKLYPNVEISEAVRSVLRHTDRKMRYMEVELKTERCGSVQENGIAQVIPSREDSYERIMEEEHREFSSPAPLPEEEAIRREEMTMLYSALEQLPAADLQLIRALYFEGISERAYAERIGKAPMTIHNRKIRIQKKLKKLMENA